MFEKLKNGSLNLNKIPPWITVFLIIISIFASIITITVTAQSDIKVNREHIVEVEYDIEHIQDMADDQESRLVEIEVHYGHIKDSLERIEAKLEDSK